MYLVFEFASLSFDNKTENEYTNCSFLFIMATKPFVRITLTPELQKVLSDLRRDFPAMKENELIKMVISGFYTLYTRNKTTLSQKDSRTDFQSLCDEISKGWAGKNRSHTFSQDEIEANTF